jgi:hypothetical protein
MITNKNNINIILPLLAFVVLLPSCTPPQTSPEPISKTETLRRSDSFFGIHFDLHASENSTELGKTLTLEMIENFLELVQPDYVQIDCKGHSGISSYPTQVGFRAAGYIGDPLALWREATRKHNVALFMHFSGILDRKVAREFPRWAITMPDGSKDPANLSVYSPYLDSIMIPQLKELNDVYQVDGVWVDGECWSINPDYGALALAEFKEISGCNNVPRNPGEPCYFEFMEFNRMLFKRHVTHYLEAMREHAPEFQVTSNWAFSSLMPGRVDIPLDFLSGDLQSQDGVYSAAFEARCLALQELPWDLMAWSFNWAPDRQIQTNTKSIDQMKQEAAQVLAMGGGIQFYFRQNRDLSIQPWTVPLMKELAAFVRERQQFTHRATQVPQVGLIFSTEAWYRGLERVYASGWTEAISEPVKGTLNALLDGQHAVEILMEHHLEDGRLNEYPVIVWPEWSYISDEFRQQLLEYVSEGGNLLIVGAEAVELFSEEIGVRVTGMDTPRRFFAANGHMAMTGGKTIDVTPAKATTVSPFYPVNDFRFEESFPAVISITFGKGQIAAICFDAGQSYFDWQNFVTRDIISETLRTLFPNPMVQVEGSSLVHVALTQKDDLLMVNLTNTSGNHANKNVSGFQEIPAVGPLNAKVHTGFRPRRVYAMPGNEKVTFGYKGGTVEFKIKELKINTIIVMEN